MFDRYDVCNQDDLNDVVAQRFDGKPLADNAVEAERDRQAGRGSISRERWPRG